LLLPTSEFGFEENYLAARFTPLIPNPKAGWSILI
jgi:hypothetical protein